MSESNPPSSPLKDVTRRAVAGAGWITGRTVLTNVINVGVMAILARNLTPAAFGLYALAQVLTRFMAVLSGAGIVSWVIRDREEGWEDRVHAAYWLNCAFCLVVLLASLALVPFIVVLFGAPDLKAVLAMVFAAYVVNQFAAVPDALLKRSMDFQKIVVRETALEISASLLSVAMAIAGFGVWSLVTPPLATAIVRVPMVMRMVRWRPTLPLRTGHWPRILRFAGNTMGSEISNTILAEGDTLLVGKSLGQTALGIYNMAWQTSNIMSRIAAGTIGKVALPALAAVSDDTQRLRMAAQRMIRVLSLVCFPPLAVLFVAAEEFLLTLYGPQWTPAALPLRILIIFAMRRCIGSPISVLYDVLGRPDLAFRQNLAYMPIYLASIWWGARYGIVGVALAVTVARTAFGFVSFYFVAMLLNMRLSDLLRPAAAPLGASVLMAAAAGGAKALMHAVAPDVAVLRLGVICAVSAAAFLMLSATLYRGMSADLRSALAPFLTRFRTTRPSVA